MNKEDAEGLDLKLLGSGAGYKIGDAPAANMLETFPNRFPHRNYIVQFYFPEFTSLCPVTGQPDFGTIILEYIPDKLCVESKSFKIYMFAFRNHQSFMETITNKILEDVYSILKPRWVRVQGLFAPRGATRIHVFCEKFLEIDDNTSREIRETVNNWRKDNSISK